MEYFLFTLKKNYANFNGRASRAEYWQYTLVQVLVFYILYGIMVFLSSLLPHADSLYDNVYVAIASGLWICYSLATIVPWLAITVRRLHDIKNSGFAFFTFLIPYVGLIIFICKLTLEGTPGPNQYGEDPKGMKGSVGLDPNILDA